MRIRVIVKPNSKKESVERVDQPQLDFGISQTDTSESRIMEMSLYRVSVTASPVEGKANDAVVRALAEYFDIARSQVRLVAGAVSKQKIFEISV